MGSLQNRLLYKTEQLLGTGRAGRGLQVYPDDLFLVSYPRSGNTWLRFLVGNLVHHLDPITFANVEDRIPAIFLATHRKLRNTPRPRILKSHEYFDPRYPKTICIVRDPRDVATSLYHYSIKRRDIPERYPLERFVPEFIEGKFFDYCGTWQENVDSWIATRQGRDNFLMLRYEDLIADCEAQMLRIAAFLAIPFAEERIANAVALSSADHMRSMEQQQSRHWKLTRNTLQDKPFVRAAKPGDWREALTPDLIHAIENVWGDLMERLGYPLFASPVHNSLSSETKRSA